MGEIEKTNQGDGERGVTGQPGKTPDSKTETTPGGVPETLTKEKAEEILQEARTAQGRVSKLNTDLDSAVKERDSLSQELSNQKTVVDDLNKRIDELEIAAVKGDPDLEAAYKQRRTAEGKVAAIEAREREVAKKEAQVKADAEAISKTTRESTIVRLATEYNVTTEWLNGLGVTDPKALEEIAKASGKKGEPPPKLKVDSGKTIGGVDWRDLSADEKIRRGTNQ